MLTLLILFSVGGAVSIVGATSHVAPGQVSKVVAATKGKQTIEVQGGHALDVPVKEQPVLVPSCNHIITAVNTSVDLFGGIAVGTSSGINEKEKEHDYTLSNGSTPLKVRIACSTRAPKWSPWGITADYHTDIPWFAAHGVNEILVYGDNKCDPMPEVCQLAKQYNMRAVYDIEASQANPNPRYTDATLYWPSYTPYEEATLRAHLQALKDAGYSGINCEGLSALTVSIINEYLPYYGSEWW